MLKPHFLAVLCLGMAAFTTPATSTTTTPTDRDWTCLNGDAEISCDADGCNVTTGDGFTPMGVSVMGDVLEVCAYTGCWSGQATLVETPATLYAVGDDLRWSHDADAPGALFQVALDKSVGVAVLNGQNYAHPMTCKAYSQGAEN